MEFSTTFVWLILGASIQLFGFGRWMTSLAAWLAPIFILHYFHLVPPITGLLWVWFALTIALGISLRGIVPIPGMAYLILPIVWGLIGSLPYVIDKLVSPSMHGVWVTLVFPLAWTSLEFLDARINPYGSWGASGYTQHDVLPLIQLASVTGVWGIGFLIAWGASVVNWAWDHQFAWPTIRGVVLTYLVIFSITLLLGGARLALARKCQTVRVAGIGWPKAIIEPAQFMRAIEPDLTPAERYDLNKAFQEIQESFLARSEREARAGTRIIVWPEANLIVFAEEENAFIDRARSLARTEQVYLLMGLATLHPGERYTFRNHAILITPAGEIGYNYTKITAVPGFEKKYSVPGDKPISFADTEYGRVASPICFDMDFESVIRQVGRGKADLMLVPASDWKEIMPLHQQMAEFRAIENGTALFRITRWGGSGAVDPYGRRLAYMDDFNALDNVMIAQVPSHAGVRTLYARIGNTFGWLCVMGLAVCIGHLFVG
ncbi:apolipoprotein N-acyltransferase [Kaarinaea lacus]